MIDQFVALHPSPSDHLVLITTTRSAAKSKATTDLLRQYLKAAAASKSTVHPSRIHLSNVELDLCNLPTIYAAAERLRFSPLSIYTGADSATPSSPHKIPRLDSVIFNAGIGGWTGIDWANLGTNVLYDGIQQATTFPTCKGSVGGLLVDPMTGKEVKNEDGSNSAEVYDKGDKGDKSERVMGQVFCANVFGHYVFAHEILPLLQATGDGTAHKPSAIGPGPARIIWESSVEAEGWDNLSLDDFQAVRTIAAYESSKRLTDVLALTAGLKSVQPYSALFFKTEGNEGKEDEDEDDSGPSAAPATYVTHPGVVCSSLFPLNWFLFALYNLAMYISRWLGSPWHPVTAYKGATAAVWVALKPTADLDALDGQRVKWGAGTTRFGTEIVKRSEVAGWGFRGRLGEETTVSTIDSVTGQPWAAGGDPLAAQFSCLPYQRNSRGRKNTATNLTAERRQEFEVLGRDCWREMERLRVEWDRRVREARENQS